MSEPGSQEKHMDSIALFFGVVFILQAILCPQWAVCAYLVFGLLLCSTLHDSQAKGWKVMLCWLPALFSDQVKGWLHR